MFDPSALKKIKNLLEQKSGVAILTHTNPDGDAIGSSLALGIYLRKAGMEVSVIIPNEVPDFLKWMPGCEMVIVNKHFPEKAEEALGRAGLIFCLDFNDPERIKGAGAALQHSEALKVLIDHHEGPKSFTDITVSDTSRGSTGELVYLAMGELLGYELLDHDIATCLYVAIMTDTGNFRYSSSYPEIFHITGELMKYDINKELIFSKVYDNYSVHRMRLMGYCISEKMVVHQEYRTAYISITQEELKHFNYQIGDTEGFVNLPFAIAGIRFTLLFIEKRDHVKISLRSKGNFQVNHFAEKHFNGGGHRNAAGGETALPLSDAVKQLEELLPLYQQELEDSFEG